MNPYLIIFLVLLFALEVLLSWHFVISAMASGDANTGVLLCIAIGSTVTFLSLFKR